jgi:hypothetical protein
LTCPENLFNPDSDKNCCSPCAKCSKKSSEKRQKLSSAFNGSPVEKAPLDVASEKSTTVGRKILSKCTGL